MSEIKVRKIAVLGGFRFPEGDAAAARVLGIGKALRDAGYEVTFLGAESAGREEDRKSDGRFEYQGFAYHSMNELRTAHLSPLKRVVRYLKTGSHTLRWLELQPANAFDALIVYHGVSRLLSRLRRLCRLRKWALVTDTTEWYDPRHLPGGRFGPVRWDQEARLRWQTPCIGNGIVISRWLEERFDRCGNHVIRIPPLVDLKDPKWVAAPNHERDAAAPLRLVYAGSPGRKDLLGNVVQAVQRLHHAGRGVALDVFGPNAAEVAALAGLNAADFDELIAKGAVTVAGRIPQSEVPRRLAAADFSIVVRPQERYANAGFPTKVVESLAAGTPVIVNPTSDLAEYLRDGVEGILLRDESPGAIVEGVERLMQTPRSQWLAMRAAAKKLAESRFDYRAYIGPLDGFIDGCIARAAASEKATNLP